MKHYKNLKELMDDVPYNYEGWENGYEVVSNIVYEALNEAEKLDISLDAIETLENYIEDITNEEIDRALIFYDDIWDMLKHYENPLTVDYNRAYESFLCDICECINDWVSDCKDAISEYLEELEDEE